jgi:hypothetical protein
MGRYADHLAPAFQPVSGVLSVQAERFSDYALTERIELNPRSPNPAYDGSQNGKQRFAKPLLHRKGCTGFEGNLPGVVF